MTGPPALAPAVVTGVPGGTTTVILASFIKALTISSTLILSIISSTLGAPEGKGPAGAPDSLFLEIILDVISLEFNPGFEAAPNNIIGGGTIGALDKLVSKNEDITSIIFLYKRIYLCLCRYRGISKRRSSIFDLWLSI